MRNILTRISISNPQCLLLQLATVAGLAVLHAAEGRKQDTTLDGWKPKDNVDRNSTTRTTTLFRCTRQANHESNREKIRTRIRCTHTVTTIRPSSLKQAQTICWERREVGQNVDNTIPMANSKGEVVLHAAAVYVQDAQKEDLNCHHEQHHVPDEEQIQPVPATLAVVFQSILHRPRKEKPQDVRGKTVQARSPTPASWASARGLRQLPSRGGSGPGCSMSRHFTNEIAPLFQLNMLLNYKLDIDIML